MMAVFVGSSGSRTSDEGPNMILSSNPLPFYREHYALYGQIHPPNYVPADRESDDHGTPHSPPGSG